jgi:hypothetical protein
MKKLLVCIAFLFCAHVSFSQTVQIDSLAKYAGKKVTICSKVTGTHVGKGDMQNVSLNFGKPFPDNACSAYISADDVANFKYKPEEFLKDKDVCITGTVKMYKGKAEIVVTGPDQITIK